MLAPMKKLGIAATVAAAVALTGCATQPTANESPSPTSAPVEQNLTSSTGAPDAGEHKVEYTGADSELAAWVERAHDAWVDFYFDSPNASSYAIFVATSDGGSMWARNLEWNAPAPGEIVITVKGNGWTEKDLTMISSYVAGVLSDSQFTDLSPKVAKVTAISENGKTRHESTA